jgi:hypothetical protein
MMINSKQTHQAGQDGTLVPRKPYSCPTLIVHGDVRDITRNTGLVSTDNGLGSVAEG